MMLHYLALALCVLLCGVTFRIRGGVLAQALPNVKGIPGNLQRCTFYFACVLTEWVAGAPPLIAIATFPAWYVSGTITLFGAIGLTRFWRDQAFLLLRGLLWVLPAALVLYWPHVTFDPFLYWGQGLPHWYLLLPFGATMGLSYWLGRSSGCKIRYLGDLDFCQTAEFIYGVVLGCGIIAACS